MAPATGAGVAGWHAWDAGLVLRNPGLTSSRQGRFSLVTDSDSLYRELGMEGRVYTCPLSEELAWSLALECAFISVPRPQAAEREGRVSLTLPGLAQLHLCSVITILQ